MRRSTPAAASVFLVALLAALLFARAYPFPAVENDAVEYLSLARNLAAGNGYTQDGATPAAYRPPLFPSLLGGWFLLVGDSSPQSVAAFQSLLHAAGVLAAFFLFLELAQSLPWACLGALWLAVNPLLLTRVPLVLQETTLLLGTTAAVLASVRLLRSPSMARAAVGGACWGVCTLGKVVSGFAPFLLLSMRFLSAPLRWRWTGREAAALLLCYAAAVAPWTGRNAARFHRFIPVNDQGAGMLEWNVTHAEIPGEPTGADFVAELDRQGMKGDARAERLWKYILDHPYHFLVTRVARNVKFFALPPRDWWDARGYFDGGKHRAGLWVTTFLFHVPFYLALLLRTGRLAGGAVAASGAFPVLLYWAYWGVHAALWGDPRFGLAVYPVLVSFALPWRPASSWSAQIH